MLNGNVLRARLIQGIIEVNQCNQFIETGTYHAATAIGIHRFLKIPVSSTEISPQNYRISRLLTLGIRDIHLRNSDSRVFIKDVIVYLKENLRIKPFFYLDAHENESDPNDLPLIDEIEQIVQLGHFVVLIDDFRVPSVQGFDARRYAGSILEVELVGDILFGVGIKNCYFPSYRANQDSGYPSGYCLFWRSSVLDAAVVTREFPFDLIRAFSIYDAGYVGS